MGWVSYFDRERRGKAARTGKEGCFGRCPEILEGRRGSDLRGVRHNGHFDFGLILYRSLERVICGYIFRIN